MSTTAMQPQHSQAIAKYIKATSESNQQTGREYKSRLTKFEEYCNSRYNFNLDDLLVSKTFKVDVYDLLSGYVSYLITKANYANLTIKQRVVTARNFLEYYDIEISPRKFKYKVKIPKSIVNYKAPLTRDFIIKILENTPNLRLKCFLLTLASTGMRAGECCSIRLKDIDFENHKIHLRPEYTKTKKYRY